MQALVKAGADVNVHKRFTGLTPLHWAAFNNDKEVVKYLIEQGAIETLSV